MLPEKSQSSYRCSNRTCPGERPRLYSWQYSFTPFGARLRAGHQLDCKGFLLATYLCSLRVPQDSAWHIVGRSQDYIDATYRTLRVCAASEQLERSKQMLLDPGVVDVDGTRTIGKKKIFDKRTFTAAAKSRMGKVLKKPAAGQLKKKPASMMHGGHLLLLKHRTSDQQAVVPLPRRITAKGAPGPPESKEEVLPLLQSKLDKEKHIAGSDSSKGLQGAFKDIGVLASQARHSLSEYTPVVKFNKKWVPRKALEALKSSSSSSTSKPMFKETRKEVAIVGGDQSTESLAGVIKRSLRRMNKLGRCDAKLALEHVDALAAVYFAETPGLEELLKAVAGHRKRFQDQCKPAEMYTDLSWLHWDNTEV